jgi:hypothetical protein
MADRIGLERNACSCSDAEHFRFLGKTLEVKETEVSRRSPDPAEDRAPCDS